MARPYQTIRYDVRGPVAEIALARPDDGNTFTAELLDELQDATTRLATEPGVRAVVLRGEGKNFCFGANVEMFAEAGRETRPALLRDLVTRFHVAVTRLARIEVPVLGVTHGQAVGGGVALLGACDLVLAAESSRFRLGWSGIGFTMDGGTTTLLPKILGPRRVLELIYTNRPFSLDEAREWGFVNFVVPDADLARKTEEIATQLAAMPTRALGLCKRLIQDGGNESLETHMEREAVALTQVAGSRDADEGFRAFLERRKPRFTGE